MSVHLASKTCKSFLFIAILALSVRCKDSQIVQNAYIYRTPNF
nr:MAG TPA: hypothetical protein [Bacteriophage sp.]